MIIISQDKETILNFKNVQEIRIEEYGTHIKGKKIYKIFNGNFEGYATLLGTYATKERAKEVLEEIINKYTEYATVKNYEGDIRQICCDIPKIYEMPEE